MILKLGLIERRERWGLTGKGWLLTVGLLAASVALSFVLVFPFLAVSSPLDSNTLVIEGWISIVGASRASRIVQSGNYTNVIVSGGPIAGTGDYNPEFGTYADQGLSRLKHAGVSPWLLCPVPAYRVNRDRTFAEACAVNSWFREHNQLPARFNILSEAVHARRTHLLFAKAFGAEAKIGIIALPPSDYPAADWWHYSAGVKDVITEGIGYIYARFFFWA